jgi:uncharacterized phage protein (TIGR02220 family)
MAKELPYFKFEPNQWENGNIQICSREEKGLFLDLCSMYWSRLGDVPFKLAVQKLCAGNATAFDSLIEEGIFTIEDKNICIDFLNEQLSEFDNVSDQNSKNAKIRWEKHRQQKDTSERNATASIPQCENDAIREEKIREEKIKDTKVSMSIDFDKLLKAFNEITNKNCRVVNSKTRAQLKARLKDGYTKQNIKDAIINCYNDKHHKESNHKYLTLEFITRPDKLERYSQAVVSSQIVTKGKGIGLKAGDFFEGTTLFVSFISDEGTAVWKNTKDML